MSVLGQTETSARQPGTSAIRPVSDLLRAHDSTPWPPSALSRASATVLTAPNCHFRSTPSNGHRPADSVDPFPARS
jgi:hypothetical protein